MAEPVTDVLTLHRHTTTQGLEEGLGDFATMSYLLRLQEADNHAGSAVDDLIELMEDIRASGNYVHSDRLRTIIGNLARSRRKSQLSGKYSDTNTNRERARSFK